MNCRRAAFLVVAALLVGAPGSALAGDHDPQHHQQPTPRLVPVGAYDTGLGANGAEIVSVRNKDGIAALTNVKVGECGSDAGAVDVLDLSDPARGVVRHELRSGELAFFGVGETAHAADVTDDGAYAPTAALTA